MNSYKTRGTVIQIEKCIHTEVYIYIYIHIWTLIIIKLQKLFTPVYYVNKITTTTMGRIRPFKK